MKNISVKHFEFRPVVQGRCCFTDIPFLALVTILYGKAEPFVLFGSAHYEEQFCEIISNLD